MSGVEATAPPLIPEEVPFIELTATEVRVPGAKPLERVDGSIRLEQWQWVWEKLEQATSDRLAKPPLITVEPATSSSLLLRVLRGGVEEEPRFVRVSCRDGQARREFLVRLPTHFGAGRGHPPTESKDAGAAEEMTLAVAHDGFYIAFGPTDADCWRRVTSRSPSPLVEPPLVPEPNSFSPTVPLDGGLLDHSALGLLRQRLGREHPHVTGKTIVFQGEPSMETVCRTLDTVSTIFPDIPDVTLGAF